MSRRLPKAPIVPLIAQAEKMLVENAAIAETMDKLQTQAAEALRRKHQAYLRAGFTDDQAFQLCRER